MKHAVNRFAGLVLLAVLLVGAPLLSAKKNHRDNDRDRDEKCEKREANCVKVPDSHGGPLLVLTAGALGATMLVRRTGKNRFLNAACDRSAASDRGLAQQFRT
jgi:hypothetical protein